MIHEYVDKSRDGDHMCYISNLAKMKAHYTKWSITKTLDDILEEIYRAWVQKSRCSEVNREAWLSQRRGSQKSYEQLCLRCTAAFGRPSFFEGYRKWVFGATCEVLTDPSTREFVSPLLGKQLIVVARKVEPARKAVEYAPAD